MLVSSGETPRTPIFPFSVALVAISVADLVVFSYHLRMTVGDVEHHGVVRGHAVVDFLSCVVRSPSYVGNSLFCVARVLFCVARVLAFVATVVVGLGGTSNVFVYPPSVPERTPRSRKMTTANDDGNFASCLSLLSQPPWLWIEAKMNIHFQNPLFPSPSYLFSFSPFSSLYSLLSFSLFSLSFLCLSLQRLLVLLPQIFLLLPLQRLFLFHLEII